MNRDLHLETRPMRRFVVALALLPIGWSVAPVAAQSAAGKPGRPLAIEDYYRIRTAGTPLLSPDGKWVAFTVSTRTEATNQDSVQVWLVPADGSAPERRVSPAAMNARDPSWEPGGGGRLSYALDTDVREYLNPAYPDSAHERIASVLKQPGPGDPVTVVRSPDGKRLALLRNTAVPARPDGIGSDFERRHETRFRGKIFDWLEFQRDASPFPVPNPVDPAVTPSREIFLGGENGAAERQLTRLGLRPQGLEWSSDGSALLFLADSSYRDELAYDHNQIWIAGIDGTIKRLSHDLDNNYSGASFSPDGRSVVATRSLSTDAVIARRLSHGGPTDLVLFPAEGGEERVLTADWDYLPQGARWSPDGRYIYFTAGIGGTNHLFRVPAAGEGGAVEQVTNGQRRLAGLSFDKSMTRMAYTVGKMEAPSDLWIADIDGRNERQLTHLHTGFTSEVALDAAERVLFKSKDGTSIEGWLYRPHGFTPGRSYPLVVFSHGGPHSAYTYGFDFKLQYFAANGYFVLTTNFRSSTGYGEKFLWATWGGWGNKDGEDVMAGVDYAIAQYPIDPKRVATVGHSYGGFMSNWLITQYPDRFAAAAVGAGIVNWVSDYGTADIARTKETEFYGTPWDPKARDLMMRQSPLSYANRVKAATLFLNGEVDQRVPYSEAEQMFVALKKNGIPAKVIQYAGQPHSIGGSWNIVHRMLNELRWLDRYLKPVAALGTP